MLPLRWTPVLLTCFLAQTPVFESRGEVTLESRIFTDDAVAETVDEGFGLFSRLDLGYRKGAWRLRLRGFARVDAQDDSRDLVAVEEAFAGYRKRGWEARLGIQMLNWTATEAFHPADVVNSRNLDSDIENPEKLGELMVSLRRRLGEGSLTGYYLPRLEAPELPASSSRLSFAPPGFDFTDPVWLEDSDTPSTDSRSDQWGLRVNQTIGDADLALFYLDHLDRQQPVVLIDAETASLTPVYQRVANIGLTWLQIAGDWVLKLEAAHKDFQEQRGAYRAFRQQDHTQIAFGIDYGWVNGRGADATLLLEGQAFLGVGEAERAALGIFQRDLLAGYRHAFNDVMGRELLLTFIFDIERDPEHLLNIRYQQRLSDTWRVQGGLRWIEAPQKDALPIGLELLDEANQIYLELSRFF